MLRARERELRSDDRGRTDRCRKWSGEPARPVPTTVPPINVILKNSCAILIGKWTQPRLSGYPENQPACSATLVPSRALLIEHRGIAIGPRLMIRVLLQDPNDPGRCFGAIWGAQSQLPGSAPYTASAGSTANDTFDPCALSGLVTSEAMSTLPNRIPFIAFPPQFASTRSNMSLRRQFNSLS